MPKDRPLPKPAIALERVYGRAPRTVSRAFLVDGLWPRGLRRSAVAAAWLSEVAPSPQLRKWFAHRVDRWPEFQRRYRLELRSRPESWSPLLAALREAPITLLYAARDTEHNNAVVLRDFLLRQVRRAPARTVVARRAVSRSDSAPAPRAGSARRSGEGSSR
jgi:uncharacterized protein YeaO (DUF488 family)